VKEFLHRHGATFEAIDVGDVEDAWDRIRAHTGGPIGTPTVVMDGAARIGFDPEWMTEKLQSTEPGA
jgi:glutaredoxin